MPTRNAIKQWSVTFPKSGEVSRQKFAESMPPYEEVTVSLEAHEDGSPHLHMAIKLKKGLSKSNMLKWIAVKWPNDFKRIDIEPTRSVKQWSDYIQKEDPEAYCVGKEVVKSNKIIDKLKKEEEEEKFWEQWLEKMWEMRHPKRTQDEIDKQKKETRERLRKEYEERKKRGMYFCNITGEWKSKYRFMSDAEEKEEYKHIMSDMVTREKIYRKVMKD